MAISTDRPLTVRSTPWTLTPLISAIVLTIVLSPFLIERSGDIAVVIAGRDRANEILIESYLSLQLVLLTLFGVWTSRVSRTYLSPPFLLAASVFLWHFAFVVGFFLYGEGLFGYTGAVFDIGPEQVEATIGFCGLCFSCLMAGVIYAYHYKLVWRRESAPPISHEREEQFSRLAHQVGVAGLILSILVLAVFDLLEGRASSAVGYEDLYLQVSGSFIYRLFYATQFFGAVFVLMALAIPTRGRPVLPAVIASLSLVFLHFLNGSRSLPFIVFVAFLVCYDTSFRRLSLPVIAGLTVGMSAFSWIVGQARVTGVGLHVFTLSAGENVNLLHFFWESGRSVGPVIMTFHFIAHESYRYGASFVQSALEIVPMTSSVIKSVIHVERPSEWLLARVATVPQGKGLGYSLVAEAFFNFGYAGCLLFFFLGAFVGRYYFGFLRTGSLYMFLMATSVTVMLSLHMRNDSGSFLRTLLISFIMFAVLKRLSQVNSFRTGRDAPPNSVSD